MTTKTKKHDKPKAVVRYGADWHDGPGWYWWSSDLPEEGSNGAFASKEIAITDAESSGYDVVTWTEYVDNNDGDILLPTENTTQRSRGTKRSRWHYGEYKGPGVFANLTKQGDLLRVVVAGDLRREDVVFIRDRLNEWLVATEEPKPDPKKPKSDGK